MYKKSLIIFLLIIILLFLFSVNSYASYELNFSFKETAKLDIPDVTWSSLSFEPKYFLLLDNTYSGKYLFFASELPFEFTTIKGINGERWTTFYLPKCKWASFGCKYDSTSFSQGDFSQYSPTSYSRSGYGWSETGVLYSNYDLMFNGEVIVEAFGSSSILLKSVKSVNTMGAVTSEIVSVLPVVLVILVGLIGTRKAIIFTRKKLRNA